MDRQKEIDRGHRARAITSDPLWIEAWDAYEKRLMSAWRDSPARDTEGREEIFKAVNIAGKVRSEIEGHMYTGKLAEIAQEKEDRHAARTKRIRSPQ